LTLEYFFIFSYSS